MVCAEKPEPPAKRPRAGPTSREEMYYTTKSCKVEEFAKLTSQITDASMLHFAAKIEKNLPIYDCNALRDHLRDPEAKQDLMAEWIWVLQKGPGAIILQQAYADTDAIDAASEVFRDIVASQKLKSGGADHFAKAGSNDRIWNAQEKLCVANPEVFARYYSNPFIAAISEAWLGPGYQVTSQVNAILPGGAAQDPHRDYHVGFQQPDVVERYPVHVHCSVSPQLTLQGAVAHVDVPLESGPTQLLPFSQLYGPGYLAWRRPEFKELFAQNFVQLALKKGDCLFFNPALMHAGGANRTSGANAVYRVVNLLQVSSAYGRAMDAVNRVKMCKVLYPVLMQMQKGEEALDPHHLHCVIAACAEGYSFPTNLDLDPPENGIAPPSQQDVLSRALSERWSVDTFNEAIDAQVIRRTPLSN